jgi:hypothetical protein
MTKKPRDTLKQKPSMARREALAKLGLVAGVAYAAPVVVPLDRSANAQVLPSPGRGGVGKGK